MAFTATLLFELDLLFRLEPLLVLVEPGFLFELLLELLPCAMTVKKWCGTSKLTVMKEKGTDRVSTCLLGSVIDNERRCILDEPSRQKFTHVTTQLTLRCDSGPSGLQTTSFKVPSFIPC